MEFSFIALLYGGFGVGLYSALVILYTLRERLSADFRRPVPLAAKVA